ncbi:fumarate hydratase [Clostridia bacterium]|nr:fumarate hydratase [Clostridia bacterium]
MSDKQKKQLSVPGVGGELLTPEPHNIREINVSEISSAVAALFIEANMTLPGDVAASIKSASEREESPLCRDVFCDLLRNLDCAKRLGVPICQDTGMAVVFMEIGQDVHFTGGDLYAAVNSGVADGYRRGNLRMSIVSDPLERVNTEDNTPAIIHTVIVPGDKVKLTAAPKGFGSENMSRLKMFTPSASPGDIIGFITETVSIAGSNPCPPVIVGVGIGGNFEHAAFLSKKALCRDIGEENENPRYREMEQTALSEINRLGIGAQGFGGRITALAVNILTAPTHIAGLPVAVNISCHVTRHAGIVI